VAWWDSRLRGTATHGQSTGCYMLSVPPSPFCCCCWSCWCGQRLHRYRWHPFEDYPRHSRTFDDINIVLLVCLSSSVCLRAKLLTKSSTNYRNHFKPGFRTKLQTLNVLSYLFLYLLVSGFSYLCYVSLPVSFGEITNLSVPSAVSMRSIGLMIETCQVYIICGLKPVQCVKAPVETLMTCRRCR